jgi:D-alanine-D-alanine ligase
MTERLRVGIFAGGRSAEHEVSVASADAVLRAIDRERFEPYLIYVDRDGRWHLPEGPAPQLGDTRLGSLLGVAGPERLFGQAQRLDAAASAVASGGALQPRAALRPLSEAIDVAFLVVHGPFGEDGTLQGFLELAGIPYIGAGVLASAVCMDKVVFKDLMRGHGLPVIDYTWLRRSSWREQPDQACRQVLEHLGERCVVKPARLGSSVGMSVVTSVAELPAALELAFGYDAKVIAERYVAGARELEVGVLGNEHPIAFAPGEVVSHNAWYDYSAKYTPGLADVVARAELDPGLGERLRQLALAAYRIVDCAGMARVDFLVPADGIFLSEMNTLPGFTATSMFPKQAELAGLPFTELIARLIELSLQAAREGRTPASASADAGAEVRP